MGTMFYTVCISFLLLVAVEANNRDQFNYELYTDEQVPGGGGTSYGQRNWRSVTCDNIEICEGYPNKFTEMKGADTIAGANNCLWCPEDGPENCGLHRQSPIDLKRDRGIIGHPQEKECPDWHWMQYRDDTCSWDDMKDQFSIERHALKIQIPTLPNGDIDCVDPDGTRQFPRLDYSKGFPDWWWLDHTSISVPSQHTQEGKRYAAEVTLAHFYEIDHPKNQLGHVVIFLQDYEDAEPWPYLDKLICQWRKIEEETRRSCNLDPAPAYGRCSLFRGQEASDESLTEAGVNVETDKPTPQPQPVPTISPNEPPSEPAEKPVESPTFSIWGFPIGVQNGPPVKPPTEPPTSKPVAATTVKPVAEPTNPNPPAQDSSTQLDSIPPPIDCGASEYAGASYARMCASSDPCCESVRSDTDMCWDYYDNIFPGDLMRSACYHCCDEPKIVGPPKAPRADLPQTIQCSSVENPYRICKDNSCCVNPRSTSGYCKGIYEQYGDNMDEICYYCCSVSKEVGPPVRRGLRYNNETAQLAGKVDTMVDMQRSMTNWNETVAAVQRELSDGIEDIPPGAKVTYVNGRKILLREENFLDSDQEADEEAYFNRLYTDHKHREMQDVTHEVDYEDVPYWPYEWLLKVGTEYYFRYEGTQMVPPCWEVIHWRVLKDPIRVHKRQIEELNRLLAWRVSPSGSNQCERDTAGRVSSDGNRVELNREIQYMHLQHRMVFCECKDWPSKFESDREWCSDWRDDAGQKRFYGTPYSFDTNGEW